MFKRIMFLQVIMDFNFNFSSIPFEIVGGKPHFSLNFLTENTPTKFRAIFEEERCLIPDSANVYGLFKNRNGKVDGIVIHNIQNFFGDELPKEKGAPKGIAVIENLGTFFIQRIDESPKTISLAFKLKQSVKPNVWVNTDSYQYGVLLLKNDFTSGKLRISLGCILTTQLFLKLTRKTKSIHLLCHWFYQWWESHVYGIFASNLIMKERLLNRAYQGGTSVDPWVNQVEALINLTKRDYPNLFSAWAKYKNASNADVKKRLRDEARYAFIAEWEKNTGSPPKFIDERGLIHDESAFNYLCNIRSRKMGSFSHPVAWWLAKNWTKLELFLMNGKQLAECYTRETGNKSNSSIMLKYRNEVGLKALLKRGKKSSTKSDS